MSKWYPGLWHDLIYSRIRVLARPRFGPTSNQQCSDACISLPSLWQNHGNSQRRKSWIWNSVSDVNRNSQFTKLSSLHWQRSDINGGIYISSVFHKTRFRVNLRSQENKILLFKLAFLKYVVVSKWHFKNYDPTLQISQICSLCTLEISRRYTIEISR